MAQAVNPSDLSLDPDSGSIPSFRVAIVRIMKKMREKSVFLGI
jgi:hypothetical protein